MENGLKPNKLRTMRAYLPKIVRFYDLKSERLTQVVFVLILLVQCASSFIVSKNTTDQLSLDYRGFSNIILIFVATVVLTDLISAIYLYACIQEFKGKEYTVSGCMSILLKKGVSLIVASTLTILALLVSSLFFIVPGVILYLMFIFNLCYILDLHLGAMESFSASRNITRGYKGQIFSLMLMFKLLFNFPAFLLAASINSIVVGTFVSAFFSTIMAFMQQRLIAMMYIDLEYSEIHKQEE